MPRFTKNEILTLIDESPHYDLGGSYGPNLRLEELLDESGTEELLRMALGYGTAPGDLRLRREIAEMQGVSADDVVITIGGMQALFLLAFILCNRGDVAVTTTPTFPPTLAALNAVGADVRALPLSFESRYHFKAEDLAPFLSEKTAIVVLTSPQNPSGVAIPIETIREVVALMERSCPNAYLVIDDTYRLAAFADDTVQPSVAAMSPRVVTTASLSKCHGAPGVRLGWAITQDRVLHEQLVVGKFNTVVSCPPIEEALALRVLQQSDRILRDRRELLAACLTKTASWVKSNEHLVEWVRPDAGAICCVRLRQNVYDDRAVDRFYESLASRGVRVSDGTWFGEARRVFRLGFAHLPLPDLDSALSLLSASLAATAV